MTDIPVIETDRLTLQEFSKDDIPALARILAEPEVAKTITADGSTPDRCLASAESRIGWHNGTWETLGYGVWSVRSRDEAIAPKGTLLGWCGYAEPDIGETPEILYALAPDYWRKGLAQEAAGAAFDWLFRETSFPTLSAIIFGRLNPASVAMVKKFGMKLNGTMAMSDFLPNRDLAKTVMDYEIWRFAEGKCADADALLFEAPYKAGQIASLGLADQDVVEARLADTARTRDVFGAHDPDDAARKAVDAFRLGLSEPDLDWYVLTREDWLGR